MHSPIYNLRHGNIIFCRSNTIRSKIIQCVLNSEWSHGVLVEVIKGVPYIQEAEQGTKLRRIRFDKWLTECEREIKIVDVRLPEDQELKDYIGTRYDTCSCINHVLYRVTGVWYGAKSGKGARRIYCFEAIALHHNIPNWWMATPKSIEQFINSK